MNLPIAWTKHLKDPEAKANLESLLRNSTTVLTRLQQIITERENALEASALKMEDYDSSGWAFKEAFRHGRQAELKAMKELLNFLG